MAVDDQSGDEVMHGLHARTAEDSKEFVRYYTDQVWNRGNLEVIDEVVVMEG
ncbi:MAG: hypothetical protein NVS4B2_28620 [Chloroflexota bacterium]